MLLLNFNSRLNFLNLFFNFIANQLDFSQLKTIFEITFQTILMTEITIINNNNNHNNNNINNNFNQMITLFKYQFIYYSKFFFMKLINNYMNN